ncbi:MAG: KamA family radical SAM protein [Deltaproteobacteria bacterium]|nr:KamA family radical SAM protein [Deltaproteobacteria bacterium]MBW2303740.1 KamA family radical SAM protein [Deltaproteobacteria bacterium]
MERAKGGRAPRRTRRPGRSRETWREILARSITSPDELPAHLATGDLSEVTARYPMRINPYYLGLIKEKGDGLYEQAVPDLREIRDTRGFEDPLGEEDLSPVPGLTHRYPDRVLFLVSAQCAMYCRFCNRKRKVGRPSMVSKETIREGLSYIRSTKAVRDVLLSGGDPLLLRDEELLDILKALREIPHVEILRIGTRVPCTLPQRVTSRLVRILKAFHPLYINTHFNHPAEVTPEAAEACRRLADAGIPLGCQTVLLRGVNDDPGIMKALMQNLLRIRVRPYYLFQADLARGTAHFWTPLDRGLGIIEALQGHTSGMCIPHFVLDLPGGKGKIPLLPRYILGEDSGVLLVKNYLGQCIRYSTPG